MPLEAPPPPPARRAADLNARYRHHGALEVLARALGDPMVGPIALVSSFGAESAVLLHMVSVIDRATPVIFLDTGMHFAETLHYQRALAERLRLAEMRVIRPDPEALFARDTEGLLHRTDADACCTLRKAEPLERALEGFDAWISGRKRFQGGQRAALDFFEAEPGTGRIKVNPLAHWAPANVAEYMDENRLPRHPLVAAGYPSIGCRTCTSRVAADEAPRAGRWRGQDKAECGIHFGPGGATRRGAGAAKTSNGAARTAERADRA